MNEDEALLEAILQLSTNHGAFRDAALRRIMQQGEQIISLTRGLDDSRKDRARLREQYDELVARVDRDHDAHRQELAQLRIWFFFLLAAVGSLVFVFVLAMVFGGR